MNLQGMVSKRIVAHARLIARCTPNLIRNTHRLAVSSAGRAPTKHNTVIGATTLLDNRAQWASLRFYSSSTSDVIPVPSMGDSISEGTVVEWLKAPGDFVQADDVVVVLETDKVSVDVRAPFAGQLEEQLAKIDENVLVGAPLFKVTKKESSDAPSVSTKPSSQVESPAQVPSSSSIGAELVTVNVPSMGDSISEGTIVTVLKNVGDYVKADEPVLIVETDKVSVDVNAPFAGKVTSILTKLDDVVQVGAPLFELAKMDVPITEVASPVVTPAPATTPSSPAPTPALSKTSPTSTPAPSASSSNSHKKWNRNETRVQLSALKLRAAQRQKDTQNAAAMLSTFQECDLGNLLAFREELGPEFEKVHGVQLGLLSTFLKASALALKQVPAVNSFLDMEAKEIVQNHFVDINVAVASSKGVVVPVIRNVETLGLADLENTLAGLSQQANDGSLALEDLAGGTFTIHNAGVHGSFLSTSMLTSPQSAILTIHGVKTRPSLFQGKIVPRPMMYLTLTYDHRIIDGREGVTFLKSIADSVADPRRLLAGL